MSQIRKVLAPPVLVLVVIYGWAQGFASIASAEDSMGTPTPTPAVTTSAAATPTPEVVEVEPPTLGVHVECAPSPSDPQGPKVWLLAWSHPFPTGPWEATENLRERTVTLTLTTPGQVWSISHTSEQVYSLLGGEYPNPNGEGTVFTGDECSPSGATTNPSTPAASSSSSATTSNPSAPESTVSPSAATSTPGAETSTTAPAATSTSTSSSSASSSAQPTAGTGSPSTPTSVGPTAGGSSSTTPSTPGAETSTTTKPTVKPSPPAPKPVVTTTTRATSWKAVKTNCTNGTVTQQRAITTTKTVDGKVVARATTFQTRVVGMTVTQKNRCPRMATVRVQVDLGAGNPDKKVNFRRKLVTCQAAYVDVANTRYLTRSVGRPLWKTRNCLYEEADVFTVKVKASLKGKARDRAIVTAVNWELGSQFRLGTRVPKTAKTTARYNMVASLRVLRDPRVGKSVWAGGPQRLLSSDALMIKG